MPSRHDVSRRPAARAGARAAPICLAFLLLAFVAGDGIAQTAMTGDARAEVLLTDWTRAMGGPSVWSGIRDLRYVVTTVWYDTATAQETRRRPRYVWLRRATDGWRVRVERREAEGHYVQVWDGEGGWATLNGALLPDTAAAVREIEYVAGDLTYWPGLPWKLRDPGVNLSYLPRDSEGTGEVLAVTFGDDVGLHPQDRFWYYFGDAESPYPTEVHYVEQGTQSRDRAHLTGWVRYGPIAFVRWRRYRNERGQPTRAILYSDFEVDRGVPGSLFERPGGP